VWRHESIAPVTCVYLMCGFQLIMVHFKHDGSEGLMKTKLLLLTSKKWRLQREGRHSRRHRIEMKSDWLFDKPRSNYCLRVAASNLASQSACLAVVTQSHCNRQ